MIFNFAHMIFGDTHNKPINMERQDSRPKTQAARMAPSYL